MGELFQKLAIFGRCLDVQGEGLAQMLYKKLPVSRGDGKYHRIGLKFETFLFEAKQSLQNTMPTHRHVEDLIA